MRDLIRPMLPMIVILAMPIIPFLIWGEQAEEWLNRWKEGEISPGVTAAATIGLLASDIFLPTPSSVVSTLAGTRLGAILGTLASWVGMSLGAVVGFALARKWGRPLVAWFSGQKEQDRAAALADRLGPAFLAIGRGVPVLAEASVLIMGVHGLPWRKFLPPVLLANLGLSAAYATMGELAERYAGLPVAIGVAVAAPVLLAAAFHRWTRPAKEEVLK